MLEWLLPTRDCKFERVVKTTAHSTVRVKVGNRYSDQDSARLQKQSVVDRLYPRLGMGSRVHPKPTIILE